MMDESHFQVQLTAVLDVLMKSAVTDICSLAESWFKSLHMEITRNKKENDDLKEKLHTMQQQQEEQLQQQKQLLHHQQQRLQHQQQKLQDQQQHQLQQKQQHNHQQPHHNNNNNLPQQAAPETDIKITKVEEVDSELEVTEDANAGCTLFVGSPTEDFATNSQKWPSAPEEQREKTTFCHICAKEVDCIKSHMERHNQKFKCHVCHKMFYNSVDFTRHLSMHTGTKHVCDVCRKTFGSKSGLLKHKSHHSRDWEKCKDCGQEFPTKRTLYSHREKAHAVPKKCLFCHLTFSCNSNLKKHLQTHRSVQS